MDELPDFEDLEAADMSAIKNVAEERLACFFVTRKGHSAAQ